MRILKKNAAIFICATLISIGGGEDRDDAIDYVCIFPPYTPKEDIEIEISKYAKSLQLLRFYDPPVDDGEIAYAGVKNQKLYFIRNSERKEFLNHKNGCSKNN